MHATKRWVRNVSAVPVLLVLAFFVFEWYIFNIVYVLPMIPLWRESISKYEHLPGQLLRAAGFNACWLLALWSYIRSVLTDPSVIPDEWSSYLRELDSGRSSSCHSCEKPQPERAEHCGACGKCVLRMDHHCIWIGNCVGFSNHKYFILTMLYGALTCFFIRDATYLRFKSVFQTVTEYPLDVIQAIRLDRIMMFSVACMLAWSLGLACLVAFVSHFVMLTCNLTSIELGNFRRNSFYLGPFANLQQIMGRFGPAWLLPVTPVPPTLDGTSFSARAKAGGDFEQVPLGKAQGEEDEEEAAVASRSAAAE